MNRDQTVIAAVIGGCVLLICCVLVAAAVVVAASVGLIVLSDSPQGGPPSPQLRLSTPTPPAATRTPRPTDLPGTTPTPVSGDTLAELARVEVPSRNLRELAMQLRGIASIPETVSAVPANHAVGDKIEFNVSNTDTNESFTVLARLIYATDNVYFFAEDVLSIDSAEVRRLVDDFQQNSYPTNREFFGSEWNPGVDGDPRLYILYARGLGFSVAGYYSSNDEYSRLAHEYSNEKEMFYINADAVDLGDSSLPGTLAHEFQHMIHWANDVNEETWMNEGFSVLAEFLNGHGADGFDYAFIRDPDLQLNSWTEDGPGADSVPHYGAAFLFLTYFLDRFGEQATQALVDEPANGMAAVDVVLADLQLTDPQTGQQLTADDVFADWVIANYLSDASLGDGRYAYGNYPDAPTVPGPTDTLRRCPAEETQQVRQYGADYFDITCEGTFTLRFAGATEAQIVPADPHGGRFAFWGHRSDESVTWLTREFDFTGQSSVTLKYWVWHSIELDYDYAYLVVSENGGRTWQIVRAPGTTDADPTGQNFGWGYNDNSGGGRQAAWIEETVDLSAYAGQLVRLGFLYVTDAAVNRPGFLVDDISIPELGYAEGFESGDGGWQALGFVRIDNRLPQKYVVQLIRRGEGGVRVERLTLNPANEGELALTLARGEQVTLVVSATTRFTTEPARYVIAVDQ